MLRPFRRSFGISAPRMSVRPDIPWYWRSLGTAVLAALLVGAGWFVAGRLGALTSVAGADVPSQVARLNEVLKRQESGIAQLRAQAAQNERQLQIERAAAADLARQVKSLTSENAALKEDLAFFQSLMSSSTDARGAAISVNRFRLQPEGEEGEYRYQMLLVQRGERAKAFQGRLEFVLNVQHGGRKLVLVVPEAKERDRRDYQLSFRFFQRIEGTFRLAPGSVLKGMQVRVFENGAHAPKLTQNLGIS